MELHEANRILRSVKSALAADGVKLPPSFDTDGLMMLLGRLDCDKFLAPKIKHAKSVGPLSAAYKKLDTQIKFFRALESAKNGVQNPVSTVSLMLLHKYICGDLDEGAGKPRQTEYTENDSAHTAPMYISGSIKSILTKMNDTDSSPAISKEDFAGYLTHYMRELIILHPFENGSDFTIRIFIMLFCRIKGFSLFYYRTSPAAIKAAESAAFIADDATPLYKIFADCLSYERTVEKKQTAPKTRREITRDLTGLPPEGISPYEDKTATEDEALPPQPQKRRDVKPKQPRPKRPEKPQIKTDGGDAKHDKADGDLHKRAQEPRRSPAHAKQEHADKRPPARKRGETKSQTNEDVLKRAIKLQQKISKLNDQLTELMMSENNAKK